MYKCAPREIIREVPDVQSVVLPECWFDDLDTTKSVFSSLYEWMLEKGGVPRGDNDSLHNRTFVGEKLYSKLLTAERARLKKQLKLKGEELDGAVSWSDMNSGPKTEVARFKIAGDVILVIPEKSRKAFHDFSTRLWKSQRKANIEKAKAKAAGATFYQWLLSQIDRPDMVGDLARDAEIDERFPQTSNSYQDFKERLEYTGAFDAFKKAWMEYIKQYPDRIPPNAWCSECGQKIEVEQAFLAWGGDCELLVLDSACLGSYGAYDVDMNSLPLADITPVVLEQLADEHDLYVPSVERCGESLRLWGVWPAEDSEGIVYFIRSEGTESIKIGYTAGEVKDRLGSLQTAHPSRLKVIATMRGTREHEKSLHTRFACHRLEGEWFRSHPDLLAFIAVLPK